MLKMGLKLIGQLLTRIQTVSASQVLSLLLRSAPVGLSVKGPEARDALFAQLFGINAIIQSKCLFAANSSLDTFQKIISRLVQLGTMKGWMRESAWWAILGATEGLLNSKVSWKSKAVDGLLEQIYDEKTWSQEKVALTLLLERQMPVGLAVLLQPSLSSRISTGRACSNRLSNTHPCSTAKIFTFSLDSSR